MRRIPGIAITLLLVGATAPHAQSLADISRQEADRRKTIQTPGRLYTNDSLRPEPPPSSTGPAVVEAADKSQTPNPKPQTEEPPGAGASVRAPQTEAEWRQRIAAVRDALARAQNSAEVLRSRIDAMTAADRQKALAEMDRVKQDIRRHQEVIDNIQEDAYRAGVPAGWVR